MRSTPSRRLLRRADILPTYFLLAFALVTLRTAAAFGQGRPGGGYGGGRRAERRAEKGEVESSSEFKVSRDQNKHLLKGIKLTGAQKDQVKLITRKYDEQYKSIDRQQRAADPASQPERTFGPQWQAMRALEKNELRAALTPEQQVRFDQNAGPPPAKS